MTYDDLTPEQQAKVDKIESTEELLEFVKCEGLELTEEQLSEIAGGKWGKQELQCPQCQSTGIDIYVDHFKCRKCNYEWKRA